MSETERFRTKLNSMLAEHKRKDSSRQESIDSDMERMLMRQGEFENVASKIYDDVVTPRFHVVEELFDDVTLNPDKGTDGVALIFNTKNRFRGTFQLEIGVSPDLEYRSGHVRYRLSVVPVFIEFKKSDELTLPLDKLTPENVCSFVESTLEHAVSAYLMYRNNPNYYHQDLSFTDPVCGMRIYVHSEHFKSQHKSGEYYFCSQVCKEKFEADPTKYTL